MNLWTGSIIGFCWRLTLWSIFTKRKHRQRASGESYKHLFRTETARTVCKTMFQIEEQEEVEK